MTMHDYLKNYQPLLFQTFGNALTSRNLSHAYLLDGESGTPLKESSLYLAKSLVCDAPNPYACNKCASCLRFDEGNYSDFYFFDGEEISIKKESVLALEKAFSMTSVESKGVLIYVMHNVENMTLEAINALLKFLEEPSANVYAFLTTNKASSVLPTIKSRSQILGLKLIKRDILFELCKFIDLPLEDIELLMPFYNLPALILSEGESERYAEYKHALITTLDTFSKNPKAGYLKAHELITPLKDRFIIKRVFTYFALFCKDVINYKIGHNLLFPSFVRITKALSEILRDPLRLVVKTYEISDKVSANVNVGLLVDELLIEMIKDTNI